MISLLTPKGLSFLMIRCMKALVNIKNLNLEKLIIKQEKSSKALT